MNHSNYYVIEVLVHTEASCVATNGAKDKTRTVKVSVVRFLCSI